MCRSRSDAKHEFLRLRADHYWRGEEPAHLSHRAGIGSTGVDEFKRTGEVYEDLFMSTRDEKGKWSEPQRLNLKVNTYDHEGPIAIMPDGQRMYLTRCDKDENKGCGIFVSNMVSGDWAEAVEVPLKTAEQEQNTVGHPALSNDGKVMVFASDIPGGQGGRDLWYSTFNDQTNSWGTPKNLGPNINTSGDELFPHIRYNGELYFCIQRPQGHGWTRHVCCRKTGDNEWSNPRNMGAPMNSNSHDFGIAFDGEFDRGFFSSDRAGGKGQDDIYSFSLPATLYALEGYVYDKDGQFPLEGAYVRVFGSDGSSFESLTDANGAFSFAQNGEERYINPEVNYSIETGKTDYLVAKG